MYRVFLGLGTNLGDRSAFLNSAARELRTLPGTKVLWYSSVYESDPEGRTDQGKFLNAAVELETTLPPPDMLAALKEVEHRVGRTPTERWGPREIDIDILMYDGLVYEDSALIVPHPDLPQRRFVLIPMSEIAPDLVHPVNGMTMEELSAACPVRGRVVKSPYHILP